MSLATRILNRSLVGLILLIIGVAATFAAIPLFTNTFPAINANVPVLSLACANANLVSIPGSVAPGSNGGVFFGCGTGSTVTGPAFTVATDGAAIPTFTLPAPYTAVALQQQSAVPTTGCSISTGQITLTSGTAVSFTGTNGKGNSYYYCLTYTNVQGTGLPSFSIAWTE